MLFTCYLLFSLDKENKHAMQNDKHVTLLKTEKNYKIGMWKKKH